MSPLSSRNKLFRRTYLGLDIAGGELRATALQRRGKGSSLLGGRVLVPPADLFSFSAREPNILDPRRFVEAVREVLGPLAGLEERIGLSLPDQAGRILLTEVETSFKSREEGVEILKWQLKQSLPADPREVRLDFQILERTESGRQRVVVALAAGKVLDQYEELLQQAGFGAAAIDFHSLNLYNFYRQRLDLGEDFVLVAVEGPLLTLQFFQNRLLTYTRVKEVTAETSRVFHEINRSLVGLRESHPAFRRAGVYLHTDWSDREELAAAVGSAFDRDIVPLDPRLNRMAAVPLNLREGQGMGMAAAIGVAECMM